MGDIYTEVLTGGGVVEREYEVEIQGIATRVQPSLVWDGRSRVGRDSRPMQVALRLARFAEKSPLNGWHIYRSKSPSKCQSM